MRAGPQLGVAKAARAPPCTLPILGRRFILSTFSTFFILKQYLANSIKRLIEHNSCNCSIYIAISGVEIW